MKQILILLTKHSDWRSRLIYRICGHGYTHSSISLENAPEHFFSFNHRGFAEEILAKHRRRGVQRSRCYHLQVSDEAYHAIESRIQWFLAHRSCFRYSRLGALCRLLRIPFQRKDQYFCSQFIAERFLHSVSRSPNLFLPNHFMELLDHRPYCVKNAENVV